MNREKITRKDEVIEKLRENMGKLREFGVKRIGIFGSVVKEALRTDSDIDLIVEFERGKATFKNVSGLIDFLEDLFGRKVDILTPDGIASIRISHIRHQIEREIEYV
ncbi:DNA polymerase beta domain protein region [Hydrogenobacter thermophilus TK-6]|uniref:DNA polymerase beta-like region/nucleotidyltransferase n=1 Tax=Hydrogenobacter thermophilus (strain DSM 6534 / IAM 12695 / TK-6) TaxID=608538 RepID=D3DG05_HYDTT|nr:nucleotidyltransferase [Hydrogenobacter thermophilus]ADO44692.1 DNA polymerase beta domain protein region [Hydrogenobacter thermophilus TK-6]BAI68757.1 DNA polymerase beta-like region/nucleotidyltransferase [Hydrogenobacter thermophilus TK-6]